MWSIGRGRKCLRPWWALCGLLYCATPVMAHLMDAQKGTLNLVDDGAFMVLSLPASALHGVDDNGDGMLSRVEVDAHAKNIQTQLLAGAQLLGPDGALPLQVVMIDVQPSGDTPAGGASHLAVLGRFQLPTTVDHAETAEFDPPDELSLRFTLFGTKNGEQQQHLTITRGQDSQWLRFTPEETTHALLPSAFAILTGYMFTGASHVLGGADHLLFLLVVLSAGWRWRGLLGALSCFTAGHALTLAACIWGGWSAPDSMVEPAIAATIVGMAAFDQWARWRDRPAPVSVRLALVFACSLIHGLGFAGALAEMTEWPPGSSPLRWALAGFNLGIEFAQVGVAIIACALAWALHRMIGAGALQRASDIASVAAMASGSVWFAQRLV